jgi:hypothetical protein
MTTITLTKQQHDALVRKSKTGWARYYSLLEETQEEMNELYTRLKDAVKERDIPQHIKDELIEMAKQLNKKYECAICMSMPEPDDVELTKCGHRFCKECLTEAKKHSPLCPVCRSKIYS